ncbi:MAG: hypothetical protein DCC71_04045 [Proteobacteria bacterium]|nr:MAG: hypothetical protein DCC71_04045 [Pseudomonadota bacterium]
MSATEPPGVSALFDAPDAADEAVLRLCEAGIPRDRIEVAVSPDAARLHYGGRARASRHQALRFAAIGGFAGLLGGAALSLVMLALPGRAEPGAALFVQLLGPNLATVAGALAGAAIGLAVPRKPKPRHTRALADRDAIVVLVEGADAQQVRDAAAQLERSGGRSVFVYG